MGGAVRAWEAAYRPFARIRLDDSEAKSDGLHRSWVMLMPEGEFVHPEYGKLHFDHKKLAEFKRHFDDRVRKIDIAFDVDHDAHAATGWLERIAFGEEIGKEPGLWGLTAWTPFGIQKLRDHLYKYFSPEFGDYTDEESGEVYSNVIIGGALTNRPFLKVMPAVKLSHSQRGKLFERPGHYTKADRKQIPAGDFAGPGQTYPIVTQQDVHDAARLIGHAANPAAVKARIKAIAKRKGFSLPKEWEDNNQQHSEHSDEVRKGGGDMARKTSSSNSASTLEIDEQNRRIFMGGKGTPKPAQDDADGDQQMYDDGDSDAESYDDDTLDDDSAEMDDGSDDDSAAMDDDESMDDGGSDDNAADANLSKKASRGSKKASRRMSKKASETLGESDTVTLREQRLARKLAETQQRMMDLERKGYANEMRAILSGWDAGEYQFVESKIKNPDAGTTRSRTVRVDLSRPARAAISRFLFSERTFRMSEQDRSEICRLFELAATGAVDLSVRGSSFDQEERRTIRSGGQPLDLDEQERVLQEQVETIALADYRKPIHKLSHEELAEAQQKAAEIVHYR